MNYLRSGAKFSKVILIGHSEGGLVAILTARRVPVDRLVLLATAARRQGDLVKAQLEKTLTPEMFKPIATAIDAMMAGQIVDPPPRGLPIPPSMQPSIASAFTQDPIDPLKLVEQPTLIIGGGRDRQVARLDFIALSAAAAVAKTLWLPDMNHVLVDVTDEADDHQAAYNRCRSEPLDPGHWSSAVPRRSCSRRRWRRGLTAALPPQSAPRCSHGITRQTKSTGRRSDATRFSPSRAAALRLIILRPGG